MKRVKSDKLFLIDGSSFCYRAFYAIKNLSTSKGQPTNAVYGVVAMLKKLLAEEAPEYLAVAFDLPEPTFRHVRYEKYKAHRPPMPQPLVEQIPVIKEVLKAYRIPILEVAGYEADDVLGTVATQAADKGLITYLVTGDKDAFQLLGPKIKVYRPTREGHELIDEKTLEGRWHVAPDQVVDVMALMGDATDAIPGVTGIGEKTAVELIQQFGSVKKLLQVLQKPTDGAEGAAGKIRPSVAEAIRKQQEQLMMSQELAALDLRVPLNYNWEQMKRQSPDQAVLTRLFRSLEFRTLVKEMEPEPPSETLPVRALPQGKALRALLDEACQAGRVSLCFVHPDASGEGAPLSVGLAWKKGTAWSAKGDEAIQAIRSILETPDLVKVCPELKETLRTLHAQGISLEKPWMDPTIASYLLDPSRASHQVPDLSLEFLDRSIGHSDPGTCAALEAEAALELAPRLEKELKEKGLLTLMNEVEIPLAGVLAQMEAKGITVDLAEFKKLSKEMDKTLTALTRQIHDLAGEGFNINSSKQLGRILFEQLRLPVIKRGKTGPSTDEEVLRRLAASHELPQRVLEYREFAKLSSTYVEAIPRLADPSTERIHASFNQTVTATGRLSASNPNLQNIPIRTEMGRQVRRAFVPSAKKACFLAADYSQIELRVLAHLSEDARLIAAFKDGLDVHRQTASEVFRVDPKAVTDDQRAAAKTINFGIVYGMTAFGLAKELGVPPPEAETFIDGYFSRYPDVRKYLDHSLEQARKLGYCTTLFGRRRYIPELTAKAQTLRQFAERIAINAPIQGSAADLIKVAMVAIDEALKSNSMRARMLIQVHDELIFEVEAQDLDRLKVLVQGTMETPSLLGKPIRLRVPIQVNLKSGNNWLEASHA